MLRIHAQSFLKDALLIAMVTKENNRQCIFSTCHCHLTFTYNICMVFYLISSRVTELHSLYKNNFHKYMTIYVF